MKFLLPLLLLPLLLEAQENEPEPAAPPALCDAAEYRQFDFWLGEWNVTSNGKPAGTNSVHTIHAGCALQENWQGAGAGGISGTSFSIYDRTSSRWHQSWVDSSGTLLLLDGGMVDDAMVLKGSRPARDGSGETLHRVRWTPNPDGSVHQLWEASTDDGRNWTVLFDGQYTKVTADS